MHAHHIKKCLGSAAPIISATKAIEQAHVLEPF